MYHHLIDHAIARSEMDVPLYRAHKIMDGFGPIPSTKIDKLRYVTHLFNTVASTVNEIDKTSGRYKGFSLAQNYNFIRLLIELIIWIPGDESNIEKLHKLENLDNLITYQPQIFTIDLLTQPSDENARLLEKIYRQWLNDSWYMFLKSEIGGYFGILPRDILTNYIVGDLIESLNDYKY